MSVFRPTKRSRSTLDHYAHSALPKDPKRLKFQRHSLGFGALTQTVQPPAKGTPHGKVTKMQLSQKFLAELNLRQKKKEEQIMKNRVKQLNREEQRLQKQIKIAEFHARVADSVRRRREEDLA